MIDFYNLEIERFKKLNLNSNQLTSFDVGAFVNNVSSKISWTRALKNDLLRLKSGVFKEEYITTSVYRPYTKQWVYFNR